VEDQKLHSYDLMGVGPFLNMFSRPFSLPLEIEHIEFMFTGYKDTFTQTCLMLKVTDVLYWSCVALTLYSK
jgi:hypothetical protein